MLEKKFTRAGKVHFPKMKPAKQERLPLVVQKKKDKLAATPQPT